MKSLGPKYDGLNIKNLNFQYLAMYHLMLIHIYDIDDISSVTYLLELLDSSQKVAGKMMYHECLMYPSEK